VRLEQRALADDAGAWNALGASLFWALWGEQHDAERLERNLAFLARHGVDFVRILGMVGAESWRDRVIDPATPDYWPAAERLLERLARHGLRAHVTLFADAQVVMPGAADRTRFVDAWAAFANRHRSRVVLMEVANEHWQNGFEGAGGVDDLRELGRRLAAATEVPVALSSAPGDAGAWCGLYAGVPGIEVATVHYDRDTGGPGGRWAPIRRPADYPAAFDAECRGQLPRAAISSEPIGPGSSVSEDNDALRLALAYAATFVAGNAAYVYHSGAGIRGGGIADRARGRNADFSRVDASALSAITALRRHLPPGMANWRRVASSELPWTGFDSSIARRDVFDVLAAASNDRVIGVLLGVERGVRVVTRHALEVTLIHPTTGGEVMRASLRAGEAWSVPSTLPGYLFLAQVH
jgi:hypothetical protein